MENLEVIAEERNEIGKGASRRLRRSGLTPAIIYGGGKEPLRLTLVHKDLVKNLEYEGFYSKILTVKINNQPEKVILKDLQRHPYRPIIMHVDFLRVSETEKLHIHVPLHFINEDKCVGVKQGGGVISHQLNEVEIRCLPKDLPEFVEVDLLNVNINEIIHLSDLVLPETVELMGHREQPVVSVHLMRGAQADEEEEAQAEGTEEKTPEQTEEKQGK